MPTVREDILPVAVFPAPKGKGTLKRASVFPAEHWEKWGGRPGLFRIMLGEQWVVRKDERVSFYTKAGVKEFYGRFALAALGLEEDETILPDIALGTKILVLSSLPREAGQSWVPSRTRSIPFLDDSGEWRVWIAFRSKPVLLADLAPLENCTGFRLNEPQHS
ncbi:MAG: hypothetical protein Q8O00_11205 [Holophaga sp.]|nr:hypothetical protein [Holophaga sp.]